MKELKTKHKKGDRYKNHEEEEEEQLAPSEHSIENDIEVEESDESMYEPSL